MTDQPSQLEHLKSLAAQLQERIAYLEKQAGSSTSKPAAPSSGGAEGAVGAVKSSLQNAAGKVREAVLPAQHLRIVLMGPPGAGQSSRLLSTGVGGDEVGWLLGQGRCC